ncbi:MAG: M48 family metallopeptidase, partial [Thiothrix sp.]
MQTFTIIFLAVLFTTTLLQLYLSLRQQRHVSRHRAKVPAPFAGKIGLHEHQKAADYTLAKGRVERVAIVLGLVMLLAWTLGGGLEWLDQQWRSLGWNALYTGTAVLISLVLIGSLLDLPLSLYRTFVLEARFGFNKMTPTTFVTDMLKGAALTLILGVPLAMLVLWLMAAAGDYWWLYAWAALTATALLLTWAYPQFIAPLFNQFTPLQDGEVAERIHALLARTGFTSKGVFVMDGSRRSAHGNAYFTGFGRNKRIVFFDTLLEHLTPAQVEAVLAHELGHFKHKHIVKGMVLSMLLTLSGFALLAWLMQQDWFYSALGVSQASTYMALVLFMLISPTFSFFITPLMAWWSRRHEFEADAFAAE